MTSERIAILGWGSLIWCPKSLKFKHAADGDNTYMGWFKDGPELPIEFARVSSKGNDNERLTLVINPSSNAVPVLWAWSGLTDLSAAKENLRQREGCGVKSVGVLRRGTAPQDEIEQIIARWADEHDVDAVIWTKLSANEGLGHNEEASASYLRGKSGESVRACIEYIRNTPPQIQTRFRPALEAVCNKLGSSS